jgi:hypothetical protein
VFRQIQHRLQVFMSLPIASLDRLALKRKLDEMGREPSHTAPETSNACVNEPWPTLLTNVGSPWLYWRLTPDAARPSQPARPLGAVQKAARRPCRGATLRS